MMRPPSRDASRRRDGGIVPASRASALPRLAAVTLLTGCCFACMQPGRLLAQAVSTTDAAPVPAPSARILLGVYAHATYTVGAQNPPVGVCAGSGEDTLWQVLGPATRKTFGLAMHGGTLFAAAGDGLHRSTDGGARWRQVTDWRMVDALAVDVSDDGRTVWLGTSKGLFRSDDGGESWESVPLPGRGWYVPAVLADREGAGALCATDLGAARLNVTTRAWEAAGLDGVAVTALARHPGDARVIAAGSEERGLHVSRDGGVTWRSVDGTEGLTVYGTCWTMDGRLFAGTFERGVLLIEDAAGAGSRAPVVMGLQGTPVRAVVYDPAVDVLYAATIGRGAFRLDRVSSGHREWAALGPGSARCWSMLVVDRE